MSKLVFIETCHFTNNTKWLRWLTHMAEVHIAHLPCMVIIMIHLDANG